MRFYDTLISYDTLEHKGIQYGVCRDFKHISRHRRLRQVVHNPSDMKDRFVALETPNPFQTQADVTYYEVPAHEENRLDVIAFKLMGSAQYAWTIAYFNGIEDGFTVHEGQKIMIPKSFTQLFNKGEVLASVSPLTLNLGTE